MKKKKKKQVIKIEPLSIKEVSSITKLVSQFEKYCKRGIPNANGTFSHFIIKSLTPFDIANINVITKWFKMDYKKTLLFETYKSGEIYVGVFSKKA